MTCHNLFSQIVNVTSNIPIIVIETNGQTILDSPRIVANMKIIENGNLDNPIIGYDGKISIEIRGSSSQSFPKKQYGFETQNNDGSNNNVSLLGLPEENDWILSAPYSDKTLIRNMLAYKLSSKLGHYAPKTKFCELIKNGEYLGVYILTEKIKRDKNRVNIANLKPNEISGDDLTGGYLLKIDKTTGGSSVGISTTIKDLFLQVEYPKSPVFEQKKYIYDYINSFENTLYSPHFSDPENGYHQFINLNAAIDYLIVNELSKNIDAYYLSTFIYKKKDSNGGKLHFGPVWDYNIAFGNAYYGDGHKTTGLLAGNHIWWEQFLKDTLFSNQLKERWSKIRKNEFSTVNILSLVDSLTNTIKEAQLRDLYKWKTIGNNIWPNFYIGKSYKDEVQYLKSWLIDRLNWLDNNMPGNFNNYSTYINHNATIFPNPFNYYFTFTYSLPESGEISIYFVDSNGNLKTTFVQNAFYEKGNHNITWNNFISKNRLPKGLYFLVLEQNGKIVSKHKLMKQ